MSDPEQFVITYSIHPYFAVSADADKLKGIRGVGETPQKALQNLRVEVAKRYPKSLYKVVEKYKESETGKWRMAE